MCYVYTKQVDTTTASALIEWGYILANQQHIFGIVILLITLTCNKTAAHIYHSNMIRSLLNIQIIWIVLYTFDMIIVHFIFSLLLAEHYQELSVRSELPQLASSNPDECAIRLLYISINWLNHLPSFRLLPVADQVSSKLSVSYYW